MIIRFVIENEEHDNNGQLHHNIVIKETITKNDLEEISNDIEQFHKENPKWTNEQSWELFESLVKNFKLSLWIPILYSYFTNIFMFY